MEKFLGTEGWSLFCYFNALKGGKPPWPSEVGCEPLDAVGAPGPICYLSSESIDQGYARIEREGRSPARWRTLAHCQCVEETEGWNTPLRAI